MITHAYIDVLVSIYGKWQTVKAIPSRWWDGDGCGGRGVVWVRYYLSIPRNTRIRGGGTKFLGWLKRIHPCHIHPHIYIYIFHLMSLIMCVCYGNSECFSCIQMKWYCPVGNFNNTDYLSHIAVWTEKCRFHFSLCIGDSQPAGGSSSQPGSHPARRGRITCAENEVHFKGNIMRVQMMGLTAIESQVFRQ